MWSQTYDPLGSPLLSTLVAAIPVAVLLSTLGLLRFKAHTAALLGLASAALIAVFVFGMPGTMAAEALGLGVLYGFYPIGWIVNNVMFLYSLTNEAGLFLVLRESITSITRDRRLQLLLVAFCFGAFFEGAAGFGTPVAVTAAILIGLGFSPLTASGLSLIANTAPVAFGALGTPIIALQSVTDLPILDLSAMVGRQLAIFSLIVPFWLIVAFAGFRGLRAVWPAVFVAGFSFSVTEVVISNYHGPWLVGVGSALVSMGAMAVFLRFWRPSDTWEHTGHEDDARAEVAHVAHPRAKVIQAWMPWVILSVLVFIWGLPVTKAFLDSFSAIRIPIAGLHNLIQRVPPVVPTPRPEAAIFVFNWLSASGTAILLSAVIAGLTMGKSIGEMVRCYGRTLKLVRFSLLTISAMMAIGYTTRYSGLDATMGLAFAKTGSFYPIFGTMLGWLGVALTGSDTASNVLFGSLQQITAAQLGLSGLLMAAANSAGGVMGKMIDAQSIVVASTATEWFGHESDILRFVFFHSLALALLVGLLVYLQAYVYPFTLLVVH
jgi:lactate permease